MIQLAMKDYYVYVVTDNDKTKLETGVSGALSMRLHELEFELPVDCKYLIYCENFREPVAAINREKEIKKLSKKKKEQLIHAHNPDWHFLNKEVYEAVRLLSAEQLL